MDDKVMDIQFSPDGRHLYVIASSVSTLNSNDPPFLFRETGDGEGSALLDVTRQFLQDEWSRDRLLRPPHGYGIEEWVRMG
jgi:hypothetical protein